MLPLRWAVGQPEPLKLPLLTFSSALAVGTGFAGAAASLSNHAQLAAAGGAAAATPHTHAHAKKTRRQAFEAIHAIAAPRAPPPRTHPASAGASWVLTSLIREASLGVGLGVVFGAVWSTMQTGPVSKRIVEYYKNNPTQS